MVERIVRHTSVPAEHKEAQKIWFAVETPASCALQLRPVANARRHLVAARGRRPCHQCQRTTSEEVMTEHTEHRGRRPRRIYFTGDCDGFRFAREALANHARRFEVVGWSDHVAQAPACSAGELNCVLHGTRAEMFPRAARSPRSGSRPGRRIMVTGLEHGDRAVEEALEAEWRSVPRAPAADRERACDPEGRSCERGIVDGRFAAGQGRDGVPAGAGQATASNLGAALAKQGEQDAASRPRPPGSATPRS